MTTEVLKQSIELAKQRKRVAELEAELDYTIKFNLKLVKQIMDLSTK